VLTPFSSKVLEEGKLACTRSRLTIFATCSSERY
jgi:hypothetical protein